VGPVGTGPFFNSLFCHDSNASADVSDFQAWVTALGTFYSAIKAFYVNAAQLTVGQKVVSYSSDPPVILPITPVSVTGTGGTSSAAPQLCALVSWQSNYASRRGRARTYIGPLSAALVGVDGNVPAASVTTLQTAANNLLAAALPVSLVVGNRDNQGELTGFLSVSRATARSHLYTQRRRAY
jgi:hypothetical protein